MKKINEAVSIENVTDKKVLTEVVDLLTLPRAYTDTSSDAKTSRAVVLKYILSSYGSHEELVDAVKDSISNFLLATYSPLEIADAIKAWGFIFPKETVSILNGLRNINHGVLRNSQHNAEGLLLGSFEIIKFKPAKDNNMLSALEKYLGYNLAAGFWKSPKCTVTPAVSGRLSQAMSDFTERAWLVPDDTYECLRSCVALVVDMQPQPLLPTEFLKIRHDLHEVLIREFTAKLLLSATPYYRWLIMKDGLASAVVQFTEDACKGASVGK
ncbi:MAG: hypothetical protein PHG25_00995 [Candidatus Pacebacteria bacterium]|nr:hypothetical protein [Candidatus Paceibacterota bacterium]